MSAHNFNIQRQLEVADMQAWMIGYYTARGYHQPKDYPEKPMFIQKPLKPNDTEMTAEDMEDRLSMFADIHNAIEGAKP